MFPDHNHNPNNNLDLVSDPHPNADPNNRGEFTRNNPVVVIQLRLKLTCVHIHIQRTCLQNKDGVFAQVPAWARYLITVPGNRTLPEYGAGARYCATQYLGTVRAVQILHQSYTKDTPGIIRKTIRIHGNTIVHSILLQLYKLVCNKLALALIIE